MSSILRTIDAVKTIHVGDYVQFHRDRVGYVESILPTNVIRIVEDDGTTGSSRQRRFNVRSTFVSVVPQSGDTSTQNRVLYQAPIPGEDTDTNQPEGFTDETKELISILKSTRKWIFDSSNSMHPFLDYLKANDHKEKGWIRKVLPLKSNNTTASKDMNSEQRMIFITTYNLFSGFAKSHGPLKGWQNYFYKSWGVSKQTANRVVYSY